MAKMLATTQRDRVHRCCLRCVDTDGRYKNGARKDPRFRKRARARDKAGWKRFEV